MTWMQFWLLTTAVYDAAYRVKNGNKHFIATICICGFMAILSGVMKW
jgi:hypothetical protein